ncbi:MAG: phosphate acetyltransferase [Acidobacteriia bacterium]|nr:phosphate acetyltransferase [Terriglobia bacterium]
MSLPESAIEFLDEQARRVRLLKKKKRIVFPEGGDGRVVEAAARLARESLVHPVLLGPKPDSAPAGVEFIDPAECSSRPKYAGLYFERRRAKGVTQTEAAQIALRPLYFAALMVNAGDADGFVGGASNSTAETVRAALHCIGAGAEVRTVSTIMILCVRDRSFGHKGLLAFADTAMVIEPTAVELAEITLATAGSLRALLGIEPVVALLSFSTKGSGKHKEVERIQEALRIVRARDASLNVDGELQADAALAPSVGESKAKGSTVAGRANTLIFPNLDAANIGYKLVERLGAAAAFGPFLQGLAKPANDLSRGCSAGDIYGVALVTALQSEKH